MTIGVGSNALLISSKRGQRDRYSDKLAVQFRYARFGVANNKSARTLIDKQKTVKAEILRVCW